jgi:hypothetical protein
MRIRNTGSPTLGVQIDRFFESLAASVVDPKLFFSDPDPIFRRVLDPDPDPTWQVKSFGSGIKHSLFHKAYNFKRLFKDLKANVSKKMLD